jgi:hypothetical protein
VHNDKLESTRLAIAEAFEILGEHVGVVRFDGKWTASGYWILRWTGVYPATVRRQLICTDSFERYRAAVVQAIASRKPVTSRKPILIAQTVSNAREA